MKPDQDLHEGVRLVMCRMPAEWACLPLFPPQAPPPVTSTISVYGPGQRRTIRYLGYICPGTGAVVTPRDMLPAMGRSRGQRREGPPLSPAHRRRSPPLSPAHRRRGPWNSYENRRQHLQDRSRALDQEFAAVMRSLAQDRRTELPPPPAEGAPAPDPPSLPSSPLTPSLPPLPPLSPLSLPPLPLPEEVLEREVSFFHPDYMNDDWDVDVYARCPSP